MAQYLLASMPAVKQFRLFRTLRVVRTLRRWKSLRTLINAVVASIVPVMQGGVLLVMTVGPPPSTAARALTTFIRNMTCELFIS